MYTKTAPIELAAIHQNIKPTSFFNSGMDNVASFKVDTFIRHIFILSILLKSYHVKNFVYRGNWFIYDTFHYPLVANLR